MFSQIRGMELIIILIIVLIIFGVGKLPQIGEALGRSIKNFKKASDVDAEKPEKSDKDKKTPEGPIT